MRDRFSARRHVAERYYDCLQCAEQCRHADNGNPSGAGGNNNNNCSNNNNGSGKNDGRGGAVGRRIRGNYRLPASGAELYPDEEAPTSPDELRRTRSARSGLSKSLARYQSAHLTPAKKRSSLARPVRVHDSSFVQPRRPMADEDVYQDPRREQQTSSCKNPWWWERRDHQEPNTSRYTYHRDAEDGSAAAGWPIRLRLEQMLELTLPQTKRKKKKKKKKKTATATATMMLMKQQQRGRHSFKDTERLLKVLSINNVDQDNRYNVKRCSVM